MSLVKSRVQNRYGQWTDCEINDQDYVSEHLQWYEIMNPSCHEAVKMEYYYEARLQNLCWEQ